MSNAAQYLSAVRFDRHAAAAAVAGLAAAELRGDRGELDRQSCRHAFEDRDERLAVRLAGRQKSQHERLILSKTDRRHSCTVVAAIDQRRRRCSSWRIGLL